MNDLSKRQQLILSNISTSEMPIGASALLKKIQNNYDISHDTLLRELTVLSANDWIMKLGRGRNIVYRIKNHLMAPVDIDSYFIKTQDERQLKNEPNAAFFKQIASTQLLPSLDYLKPKISAYQKLVSQLSADIHQRELERFVIDLAYKSSAIEGNTYSLLETEALLKANRPAEGHSKKEALMILNHKIAFEMIMESLASFKIIKLADILNIHKILTDGLDVHTGLRKYIIGITGTNYRPSENHFLLREDLESVIEIINRKTNIAEKAILISGLIIYLQPFSDANKRTGRMTANAVLLAHGLAPISYRNIDG
jgi:Fic family protein